jgi:hypothetical protein
MLVDNHDYIEKNARLSWIELAIGVMFDVGIFIENPLLCEISFQTKTNFDSKNLIKVQYLFYFPEYPPDRQMFHILIEPSSVRYSLSDFPDYDFYKPLNLNNYPILFNEAEDCILEKHLIINTDNARIQYIGNFDEPKVTFGDQYTVGCQTGRVTII